MYFATNLPLASLPTQIWQEFQGLSGKFQSGSLKLFALVDCAFDEAFLDARYRRTPPPKSLYANTTLQNFGVAAPHLLTSPDGPSESEAWLSYLFAACGNKPMLSVIASPLSAEDFTRHMRCYIIAKTFDTLEWPVRWADTRALPELLAALTEIQRNHFLSPVARWWAPMRDGKLRCWDGLAKVSSTAEFDKLLLTDEVFATLVDGAEADTVLSKIYDSQPDLLRSDSPAECHARIARNLNLAGTNGIHAAPARQHFSVLALLLADNFMEHPLMIELLQRTRNGSDYMNEVKNLSDEFWSDNERL